MSSTGMNLKKDLNRKPICALVEFDDSTLALFPKGADTSMVNTQFGESVEVLHVEQSLFDEICSLSDNQQRVNALFKNRNPVF